ncbi:PD-(D/E)XK nuclease family protein [Paenibacillus sanguinis]|uniref:PD-(D/E)XK nuclease family protein n=1 Tax=Paenibacillus sanguinis TaxID=225906 RepID=UPI00146F78ED|nr:PD-(D/E)XK nuclease family protein [Paenibacillus sanguinis]
MNVETVTLESLIVQNAKSELSRRQIRLINREQGFWLVYELMLTHMHENNGYVPKESVTAGIVQRFHNALQELRLAGIKAAQLNPLDFENLSKGRYVLNLLGMYERELARRSWTDMTGLLDLLPGGNPAAVEYMISSFHYESLSRVEREMLNRLSVNKLYIWQEGRLFPQSLTQNDRGQIEMFRAAGTLAEIREVIRRIYLQEVPFDQVELILSDYTGSYVTIHTLMEYLNIPCTFSQGISTSFSNLGKAAIAYLEWLDSGFRVDVLIQAFRNGVLSTRSLEKGELNMTSLQLVRVLEQSGIGWGRERYELLDICTEHFGNPEHAAACNAWSLLFKELLIRLPEDRNWSIQDVLEGLVLFLENCTDIVDVHDHSVLTSLKEQRDSLIILEPSAISSESAVRYVKDSVMNLCIKQASPQSGHLHISSLENGGESGRTHTFILGMDDGAWSFSAKEDPILLDEEKKGIDGLRTMAESVKQAKQERAERLGGIGGYVNLSYSSYDPVNQQDNYAAFELLQVCRGYTENEDMDFSEMNAILGIPAGFMTWQEDCNQDESRNRLDRSDFWLGRLVAEGKAFLVDEALSATFPCSIGLRKEVQGDTLTEADGLIQPHGEMAIRYRGNSGIHLSVTELERYAECPKRFFYGSILKVREKDTPVFDRNIWLGPADRGSLLHVIFYRYLKERVEFHLENEIGDRTLQHDYSRIKHLADEVISEYRRRIPPPSPHVFEQECKAIHQDVEVFYQTELKRQTLPKWFELSLSTDDHPLEVVLDSETVLYMKGFVDRVDELRPHEYKIYDYKTGNPRKYGENAYFAGGTQLQHALYAVAVEQYLRQTRLDPEARVIESAYYFPTERGKGEEVLRVQNRKLELVQLVKRLLDSIESGVFLGTPHADSCRWCPYKPVCGNQGDLVKAKWENEQNELLLAWKEVSAYA